MDLQLKFINRSMTSDGDDVGRRSTSPPELVDMRNGSMLATATNLLIHV